MAVPHLALDFRPGHQRGHRVDHHDVQSPRPDERLGDFQRLLTGVRLGDQQGVHVHPQGPGVHRIEGVLHVDERRLAALLLGLRHGMQRQGGLARRLRPVNLDDTTAGQAADAQRRIQRHGAGGNAFHVHAHVLPQAHDRALAVILLNLLQGGLQGLLALIPHGRLHARLFRSFLLDIRHIVILLSKALDSNALICSISFSIIRDPYGKSNRFGEKSKHSFEIIRVYFLQPTTTRWIPPKSSRISSPVKPTSSNSADTAAACPAPTSTAQKPPGQSLAAQTRAITR